MPQAPRAWVQVVPYVGRASPERGSTLRRCSSRVAGRPPRWRRRPSTRSGGRHRDSLRPLVAGHLVDVQSSAILLVAVLVSGLTGWSWVDALAGLAGAFLLSYAAARLVVGSGAVLVEA